MDISMKDGAVLCVSDSLDNICSWVAVEQEDWFEDEITFLRAACKQGWRVIDAGTGNGVYSLALALRGASAVWAIEPAVGPFERLCRTIYLNKLDDRVFPLHLGLSEPTTTVAQSGLEQGKPAAGQAIEVLESVSLDNLFEERLLPHGNIDLIRFDADGEGLGIVHGGRRFFSEQSPLVMLAVDHQRGFDLELVSALRDLGYGIYSLLPALLCLRPVAPGDENALDPLTSTLFACKIDRAQMMVADGWLVRPTNDGLPACGVSADMLSELLALPMLSEGIPPGWAAFDCASPYGQALLAWCASRQVKHGPAMRWALLRMAQQYIGEALTTEDYHPAVTMLATRVLSDLGERTRAVQAATAFLDQMSLADMQDDRPVPPVLEGFDHRNVRTSLAAFLFQSVVEFAIVRKAHSSFFDTADAKFFNGALSNPEHSSEIERRAVLFAVRDGMEFGRYDLTWLLEQEGNPNVMFWRGIAVPLGFFTSMRHISFAELMAQGQAKLDSKSFQVALTYFRQASYASPAAVEAHFNVGVALMRLKQWQGAARAFREALKLQPRYWQAENYLGLVLAADHRYLDAEGVYRNGLAENLDCFDLHLNFASCLHETGCWTEAVYYLRQALRLKGDSALALDMLGTILNSLGRSSEALPLLQKAVEVLPSWAQAWNNLGGCHLIRGEIDEAERCHRESVKCAPEFMPAWTNRLRVCNYRTRDQDEIFNLHKEFGAKAREIYGTPDLSRFKITREKQKRLRIGFVSGDFRRHSVSYFVEGLLEHLDRKDFQLFAYFTHTPDPRTFDFKKYFSHWRDIKWKEDQEVVTQIIDDKIDILFDLAGHTGSNRLGVFAHKPAPVQVTWIGYPNTTGLDTIDYRLTDALVDPEGDADRYCTERLWRLPETFLCYSPPASAPPLAAPPMASNGFVTFGSFNTRYKLGDETLMLWSRVLAANPGSRMLIKSALGLSELEARELLKGRLVDLGIAADRIEVEEARGSLVDHLELYNSIDIALDPFPYHGTTTTFEALWMGVPVVTLAGDRHASRVGVSILTNAGLPELVAMDADQYARIATELANDQNRLVHWRNTMRERLLATPLLDAERMAANLGDALRVMWTSYCDSPVQPDAKTVPQATLRRSLMKLHVGGIEARVGWKILNALPGKQVDFVGDVRDLTRFSGESCSDIYCSHILEHLGQGEILPVLSELHRLLCPGGKLYISVPDLDTLSWLFLSPKFSKPMRFRIMRMMFGGQADEYDFHQIGLNVDFMCDYLRDVGFSSVEHVELHNIFNDTSALKIGDTLISLNLVAIK